MDIGSIKFLAIAGIMMAAAIAPPIAIGRLASHAMDAIGRNPEASSKIQTAMVLAIAFVEAIAVYALVVVLILKFV